MFHVIYHISYIIYHIPYVYIYNFCHIPNHILHFTSSPYHVPIRQVLSLRLVNAALTFFLIAFLEPSVARKKCVWDGGWIMDIPPFHETPISKPINQGKTWYNSYGSFITGNFRILKWSNVRTIFQAIFCGDIAWNLGWKICLIYIGRYLQWVGSEMAIDLGWSLGWLLGGSSYLVNGW